MTPHENAPDWYDEDVRSINADAQNLLERYSGLKPEEVLPHVLSLRDEAFYVYRYPCIGEMRFLSFNLRRMPFYNQVLNHLRESPSAKFLDAGCCLGQEIRSLVDHGIPSN
ncbi:uncharacterized protein KD926_010193 [Aspergillus affinis]|uniref:uncharacterized protein n=1 Tax=Aspergillus affinis TaxID=1070780 RepID=UPI0022FF0318|nr:uncharacterized protein KD926_010193 [Aspergillus affinis]KAI9038860.1 hypothetical protein KD926_010193 [Aspergillus affinis]